MDSDGKIINDSRALRIARGAGVHPIYIKEVLEVFKPFQKAAAGMKKMNLPIGKNGEISKMAAGKFDMKQMANMLPPQMVQKMGGMQGLQNMMKQMASGGMPGMPAGMGDMMKMFGGGR